LRVDYVDYEDLDDCIASFLEWSKETPSEARRSSAKWFRGTLSDFSQFLAGDPHTVAASRWSLNVVKQKDPENKGKIVRAREFRRLRKWMTLNVEDVSGVVHNPSRDMVCSFYMRCHGLFI
jgi:hypothetical protein